MNRLTQLVVAAACSLPMLSIAQTGGSMAPPKIQPADQPSSDLQKQKTEQTGNATKYGQSGTADSSQTTATGDTSATKSKRSTKAKKSTTTPSTDNATTTPGS